jgi:hypothetical protein
MIVSDPVAVSQFGAALTQSLHYPAAILGAVFVLVVGFTLARNAGRGAAKTTTDV